MTRAELQEEFDMLEGVNEQGCFIDLNLVHASDIALVIELAKRGYRIHGVPDGR